MIYQMADTAMNPRHTVREIVGRPVRFYFGRSVRETEARVRELLAMIELGEEFADRLPGELSGGQKQRICIARALAAEPDLVICDEVTSALDQIVQEGILKLLARLQVELGVSYVFITHDIATVRAIADEVVVMHQGRVVEQGPKDAIFAPPHPPYTELLLSSVPRMEAGWLDRTVAARASSEPAAGG
jgi:peptide/nickel transport system ATP-binding protein